jgi:hypothetical protein
LVVVEGVVEVLVVAVSVDEVVVPVCVGVVEVPVALEAPVGDGLALPLPAVLEAGGAPDAVVATVPVGGVAGVCPLEVIVAGGEDAAAGLRYEGVVDACGPLVVAVRGLGAREVGGAAMRVLDVALAKLVVL